jgi:nucleoside-diphosphate-sugar epimerase
LAEKVSITQLEFILHQGPCYPLFDKRYYFAVEMYVIVSILVAVQEYLSPSPRQQKFLIKLRTAKLEPEYTAKFRAGDIRHCFPDISRIKSKLGFKPQTNFERGMKELIAWSEKEKADDKTAQANAELRNRKLVF